MILFLKNKKNMFSKLLKPLKPAVLSGLKCGSSITLLASRVLAGYPRVDPPARTFWGIPLSQYDMPISKKMQFLHVIKEYWELIPVFAVTFFSMMILVLAIVWAIRNKVDVVFSSHSRGNISRTMDLRNPSAHKVLTINQKYKPWPEMQIVLDKMVFAEKREYRRSLSCTHP